MYFNLCTNNAINIYFISVTSIFDVSVPALYQFKVLFLKSRAPYLPSPNYKILYDLTYQEMIV